jgi:hypothetical protein
VAIEPVVGRPLSANVDRKAIPRREVADVADIGAIPQGRGRRRIDRPLATILPGIEGAGIYRFKAG